MFFHYFEIFMNISIAILIVFTIIKLRKTWLDKTFLYVQYNVSNSLKYITTSNGEIKYVKSTHIDVPFTGKDRAEVILKQLTDAFPLEKKFYNITVKKGLILIDLKDVKPGTYCIKKGYIYVKVEAPDFNGFKLRISQVLPDSSNDESIYRDIDGSRTMSTIVTSPSGKYLVQDIYMIIQKEDKVVEITI